MPFPKRKKEIEDSYLRDALLRLSRHRLAMVSLIVLLAEILILAVGPFIYRTDPNANLGIGFYAPPGRGHPFGTDGVGRDNLARLLSGGRISLTVGFFASLISMLTGVPLGLAAGYYKGIAEQVIMRSTEIFQTIPSMVLMLVLVAIFNPSVPLLIAIIGVLGWVGYARLVYSSVLAVSQKEYVESARAAGEKDRRILTRYILPNVITPVLISFTFGIAGAILEESGLSFLGLGVQLPQASWGNILNTARNIVVLSMFPWCWIPAGIALVITVSAINFLGDGIRDALDTSARI